MVTHVGRANHGAVVLIVKDAEAPHAGPQLVCVLARAKPYADAVPKEQLLVGKGVELRVARLVAVVIRVLAYSQRWRVAHSRGGRAARRPLCRGHVVGVSWTCRGRVVGVSWTCVVDVCRGRVSWTCVVDVCRV